MANTGVADLGSGDPRSADVGPLASGAHSFRARFAGDANYNQLPGGSVACEPLSVLGTQNGLTLGFYSNKNGEQALTGSQTGTTLLASVSSCVFGPLANGTNSVLVIGTGAYKTVAYFTASGGYANVKSYLLGATATNMGYMLSAQLLTTEFNVCLGKVDPTKSIYVPAVTLPGTSTLLSAALQNALATNGVSVNGVAKISDILNAAIAELKIHPNTTAAGANRTYQEALRICSTQSTTTRRSSCRKH